MPGSLVMQDQSRATEQPCKPPHGAEKARSGRGHGLAEVPSPHGPGCRDSGKARWLQFNPAAVNSHELTPVDPVQQHDGRPLHSRVNCSAARGMGLSLSLMASVERPPYCAAVSARASVRKQR